MSSPYRRYFVGLDHPFLACDGQLCYISLPKFFSHLVRCYISLLVRWLDYIGSKLFCVRMMASLIVAML